jgi:hypothetical protein
MRGRRRNETMSKLAEIIKLGIAPGFNTKTTDPTLPQNAVPRAFKELEQTQSASSIARESQFSVKQIKKIWNMLAMLTALLAWPALAGDLTRSITFSDGQRITAAQLHSLIDGASIGATFLTGKNLNSTVETADYVMVYDTSAGVFTKMTLSTLLMANTGLITTQAEDVNPAYNDYVLTYDASASSFAKVSITNLLYNTNLIAVLPSITNLTQSATMWVRHSGTNAQIEVTNLWLRFTYRAAFTNLAQHTAPTNTDRLLIWDSLGLTNKWTGLSGLITNLPTVTTNGAADWLLIVTNGNVSKISANSFSNSIAAQLVANTLPRKFSSTPTNIAGITGAGKWVDEAHGLSGTPQMVEAVFVCTGANLNYSVGDEVRVYYPDIVSSVPFATSTTVGFVCNGASSNFRIPNKSTGTMSTMNTANWSLKLYATYFP